MAETLTFWQGDVRRIDQFVDSDVAFSVTSVTCNIWDSAGTLIVNGGVGAFDNGTSATEHEIWYVWDTTNVAAGDYTYLLKYVVAGQTIGIQGRAVVLSPTSKYQRYVNRLVDWLIETEVGEAQRAISWRQMRGAVDAAVSKYQGCKPQRKQTTVALASSTFEYSLPSDWVNEFSEFELFEYPVDDTQETRLFVPALEWMIEELRSKWRFLTIMPQTGQSARITYTTTHTLSDSTDTIPAQDFDSVCQYAAGLALVQLANRAVSTSLPGVGASMATGRTQQLEYAQQAKAMMDEAYGSWIKGATQRPFETWSYLPEHGRVYSIW